MLSSGNPKCQRERDKLINKRKLPARKLADMVCEINPAQK